MERFIRLMQDYLAGLNTAEEFASQYKWLRTQELDTSDADPDLLAELDTVQRDAFAGRITPEEFDRIFPEIARKVAISSGKSIMPFTREADILTGELMIAVDGLGLDPKLHPDLVIEEPEFREIIKRLLDELLKL